MFFVFYWNQHFSKELSTTISTVLKSNKICTLTNQSMVNQTWISYIWQTADNTYYCTNDHTHIWSAYQMSLWKDYTIHYSLIWPRQHFSTKNVIKYWDPNTDDKKNAKFTKHVTRIHSCQVQIWSGQSIILKHTVCNKSLWIPVDKIVTLHTQMYLCGN